MVQTAGFSDEEVQPVAHQRPKPVEQLQLRRSVVAVVAAVMPYDVIVLRRDGGPVLLLVRAGTSEEHLTLTGSADQVVVDERRFADAANAGDHERYGRDELVEHAEKVDVGVVADRSGQDQPVCMSVKFTLPANSPARERPQWATVSISKNPGSASTSSPALWILIDFRYGLSGLVAVFPRIGSVSQEAARQRSIVAGDICSISQRTD